MQNKGEVMVTPRHCPQAVTGQSLIIRHLNCYNCLQIGVPVFSICVLYNHLDACFLLFSFFLFFWREKKNKNKNSKLNHWMDSYWSVTGVSLRERRQTPSPWETSAQSTQPSSWGPQGRSKHSTAETVLHNSLIIFSILFATQWSWWFNSFCALS